MRNSMGHAKNEVCSLTQIFNSNASDLFPFGEIGIATPMADPRPFYANDIDWGDDYPAWDDGDDQSNVFVVTLDMIRDFVRAHTSES